jgi:tetratricopeptide (TPR) repeat protein
MRVKLLPGGRPTTQGSRTGSPDAYNQYLLGRDLARRGSLDDTRRALAAFEKALALDPQYAAAWAGVADCYNGLHGVGTQASEADRPYEGDPEHRRRALAAAERAVVLAPDDAVTLRARARVRGNFFYDWDGARADLERALAVSPSDASALGSYAGLLGALGRFPEAIAAGSNATKLDPLNVGAWVTLGALFNGTGQLDRARDALNRALEISPDHDWASLNLSANLLLTGRPAAALARARRSPVWYTRLLITALAQHDLGNPGESQAALDELVAMNGALEVAMVHAWRGNRDRAFEWLERAYALRDPGLILLKIYPLLGNLHDDPRWKPFLRKMNLPVD